MSTTKKIKTLTAVLISLTVLFWLYWMIEIAGRGLQVIFTDVMLNWYIVETHTAITWNIRAIMGLLFLATFASGTFAFGCAVRMLYGLWQGSYFTHKTCWGIQMFGLALLISMGIDTVFATFDHSIVTWNNTGVSQEIGQTISEGRPYIAPRFEYDPGDISLALCGMGFFIIGWVFDQALKIQSENESFV